MYVLVIRRSVVFTLPDNTILIDNKESAGSGAAGIGHRTPENSERRMRHKNPSLLGPGLEKLLFSVDKSPRRAQNGVVPNSPGQSQ